MTFFAQILGSTLLGVVSSYAPSQNGNMGQASRKQSAKGRK
ncbi:hypothetical protein [uncultured Roseibium sp.]